MTTLESGPQKAKRITQAVTDWLQAEAASSSDFNSRNVYLNNFENQRTAIALPVDDSGNINVQKQRSHLNRLPFWFQAYELDPSNDYQSGKLLFGPLMFLSGQRRQEALFQATNDNDYVTRRHQPLRIPLSTIIETRLLEVSEPNISTIDESITNGIKVSGQAIIAINERARLGEDFGKEMSPAVEYLYEVQKTWLEVTTDMIAYAAKVRGGRLEAVPFLEAKSISDDPQVYYPFK